MLLDPDAAELFDRLATAALRRTGRRVDRSALVRAFLRLAGDDAALRNQVIDEATKP